MAGLVADALAVRREIPWWAPVLGDRELELLAEVVRSQFPNDGDYTTRFEQAIAQRCGVPHAVAVTSGTAAVFLGLAAVGVGPGDEVVVPDVTFIATANAVRLAGATPVLVEVRERDFTIDPQDMERRITSRTKAVIPVHVSGRAADMPAILEIARRHRLFVIEDAAEALGSSRQGRALGTWGDLGCLSFAPSKTITAGQGGMVLTRHARLARRLRELKDQGRPVRGTGGDDEHVSVGYNFKLTNLQAAVGLAQLEQLDARQVRLRQIYEWYRDALAGVPHVRLPGFDVAAGERPQWIDAMVEGRDALVAHLAAHKIRTRNFWHPLHTQVPYRMDGEPFPISSKVSARSLWLPSAFCLTDEDLQRVCQAIRQWASGA